LRIPRALAWLLVGMGVFTAGLLRQYHDLTPGASFLGPAVGSLLFGCILFLFLVAVRDHVRDRDRLVLEVGCLVEAVDEPGVP